MEPKLYIQKCHNGKIRVYKGKLPPIENGPYFEQGVSDDGLAVIIAKEKPKQTNWVLIFGVLVVSCLFGGLLFWFLKMH